MGFFGKMGKTDFIKFIRGNQGKGNPMGNFMGIFSTRELLC